MTSSKSTLSIISACISWSETHVLPCWEISISANCLCCLEVALLHVTQDNHSGCRCGFFLVCFISTYNRGQIQKMDSHSPRVWLGFQSVKSKKSLLFVELISKFPKEETIVVEEDTFPDEYILFISTSNPWYGDILVYLYTLKCHVSFLWEDRPKLRVSAKK